ncbi:DUF998 domain-containing protein [Natronosalvus rutilus]|uniref:DUF998 domain-containing protein n=1 Tax=Natronosalvus rutilus TaxID=2953753 RepID=A0A9E7SUQ7_9EURY|nr:DUF998 domain-containing protein [Natronosalvus rutilus]UTF53127.1 DUF998 domain-containing protein [Natronosalvus rutilus]
MTDRRTLAIRCGVAAPNVALAGIVLSTFVAAPETFTWQTRALSDMGRVTARTFWLFNGGLILGGLLGTPFVALLWTGARNRLERIGIVLTGVAVLGMVGVGIFFLGHTAYYLESSLHGLAALMVFGVAPIAQLLTGTGQVLAGDRWIAVASIWLGVAHLAGWLGWLLVRSAAADPGHWFAVPEFVAAVAFGVWILILAKTAAVRSGTRDGSRTTTGSRRTG